MTFIARYRPLAPAGTGAESCRDIPNGTSRILKAILVAIVTSISCFAALEADAADIYTRELPYSNQVKPLYDWTGLYFGPNIGYEQVQGSAIASTNKASSFVSQGVGGVTGGGQAGYNWQIPNWFDPMGMVVGFETDFDVSDQKGSQAVVVGGETFSTNIRVPWLWTLRTRLGLPVGPAGAWLIYGTGGVAFGRFQSTAAVGGLVTANLDATAGRAAWTAGAGLEVGLTSRWSWKAEYLYLESGAFSATAAGLPFGVSLSIGRITEHTFRTGVNYHY